MITQSVYNELLLTGTGHIQHTYTHSGAFVKKLIQGKAPVVVYLDSANKEPLYSNTASAMMGERLNFEKQFAQYYHMDIWWLQGLEYRPEDLAVFRRDQNFVYLG